MIKAIVIGDPHFKTKNIEYLKCVINDSVEFIKKKSPDLVVILGDMFDAHSRLNTQMQNLAAKWIECISEENGYYTVILVGNHDRPNNHSYQIEDHSLYTLKKHKNVRIVDKACSEHLVDSEGNKRRIVYVPYVPPGTFMKELDTLPVSISEDRPIAIFAHQEFKGVKLGPKPSTEGDAWTENMPFVISGHIHNYHFLQSNICYVGTPYQVSDHEDTNKAICLFRLSGTPIQPERVKTSAPVRKVFNIKTEDLDSFDGQKLDEHSKLVIKGTLSEIAAAKVKLAGVKNVKYKVVSEVMTAISQKSFLEILHSLVQENKCAMEAYTYITK